MRDAMNQTELNLIASLIAGGETREAIQDAFDDVAESFWERNWASLEARAARATPRRLRTPEEVEQDQLEGRRLDALSRRGAHRQFTVKRAIGR